MPNPQGLMDANRVVDEESVKVERPERSEDERP
jgi:hypothetical protein